jgi:hypothetical protein
VSIQKGTQMEKNIFLRIDEDLKRQAFDTIENRKAAGKIPDSSNLSSVIRGLLRTWIKKG